MTPPAHASVKFETILAITGLTADTIAIISVLVASQWRILVLTSAVLAVALGLYLVLRVWNNGSRRILGLGLVVLMAGAIVLAVTLDHTYFWPVQASGRVDPAVTVTTPAPAPPPGVLPSPTPINPSTTAPPSDAPTTAPASQPGVLYQGQVRLSYQTGTDLEHGAQVDDTVDGPNGPIDLYIDKYGYIKANGGNMYGDSGPANQAYGRCARALQLQRQPAYAIASPGLQYCFATSDHHVAWFYINDASLAPLSSEGYAVLNAVVWDAQG